jgi:hypothetical protein
VRVAIGTLLKSVERIEQRLKTRERSNASVLDHMRAEPAAVMTAGHMPPDPWQEGLLRSEADRIMLLCSRQCFDADTVVLDRSGRACRIRHHPDAWCTGVRPVRRYTVRGGASVTVTDNHPLWSKGGWVAASTLKVGDRIAVLSRWDRFPEYRCEHAGEVDHVGDDGEEFHLAPIVKIEELGPREVWDITVPDKGWLVAQGIKAHNSGKSSVSAALAVRTALLQPNSPVLLLSPSQRQSGELFRKVLDLYTALGRPVPPVRESALQLELANGSRVLSLPGTEGTVRGFSRVALLIIDEAARVSDPLYYAVRPMLAVSRGRLVALSTPFGQRGWFYDEWSGPGNWERVCIKAEEVPRITREFLEEERRALGDRWYAQEFCCSFETTTDAVFDYRDIQAALVDDVQPLFPAGGDP